jgi:hypothetical protein
MPQPKGSAERIEARRRQALRLADPGFPPNEDGRLLDAAPSSVVRWRDAAKNRGKRSRCVLPGSAASPDESATQARRSSCCP